MSDAPTHAPEDREEFMRLFVRHEPRLYAYIRSLIFSRADADDVFQDVAAVLWRKFPEFEPGTRFDSWAFRIAHNQILYHRQKRQRDRLQFDDALLETVAADAAGETAALAERREALAHCLEKLTADERELVRRRYEPDATNRAVARATGRSESAISRALNRVYLALLACLENTGLGASRERS